MIKICGRFFVLLQPPHYDSLRSYDADIIWALLKQLIKKGDVPDELLL
jgi:hypothetical protein